MKHFLNILKYSLVLSLVVTMASCGGGDDDDGGTDVDPTIAIAEALTKGQASFSNVTPPDGASTLDWSSMTLTFTGSVDGGTYATTNSPNTNVWPANGNWAFKEGTDGKVIVRDGTTDVTVSVGTAELTTTFSVDQPATGGRIKQIGGEWDFEFAFPQ
ncbi:hypothetical protein [Reichenbachiella sp.]|uniref:hypothetical protein n=1 Tax=Reichenbachiella sp. TaxID=2184521 RepID=UPI003BB1C36B